MVVLQPLRTDLEIDLDSVCPGDICLARIKDSVRFETL